mgnify:CR=1 FL=1
MSTIAPEARMGNDIARQFAHLPEDEALARIVTHVSTFWTPAMRERLQKLAAAGSPDLDPLLAGAAARL